MSAAGSPQAVNEIGSQKGAASGAPILEIRSLAKRFGGLVAVNALNMSVSPGAVHGLIGPNGAGKSTVFDLISGLQNPSGGRVLIDGVDVTGLSVQQRVRRGICRTFQTPKLFEKMKVLDLVMTGCHVHGKMGLWGSTFRVAAKRSEEALMRAQSEALLQKVGLSGEGSTPVVSLSYGKRRLVEIARALATRPRILLLDEVASGLNPVETTGVGDLIQSLAADGLTVVLVEHDMPFVMGMCHQVTVLNFGSLIASGSPAEVARDPGVIEAYLGTPHVARIPYRDQRKAALSAPPPNM